MTAIPRRRAPVFVVGSPRSGTTFLYHTLLSAGGFAVYLAEAHVFNLLGPLFGDLSRPSRRRRLLEAWLPSEYARRSGLDLQVFADRVLDECQTPGDFLRLLMDSIAADQRAVRWAECTPENLLYVHEIKQQIPEALFLHVIRDGRDVACSIAEQGWIRTRLGPETRRLKSGFYWEWMVGRGREQLEAYPADVLELHYEALVERPQETLARISAFIDHDLDYDRIRRAAIGTVGRPNTSFPQPGRLPSAFRPVRRWQRGLDADQIVRLEAAIGGALRTLGYPLVSDEAALRKARRQMAAIRGLWHAGFSGRLWLKTHTPLGQVLTSGAQLSDFHVADRDRLRQVDSGGARA